MWGGAAPGIGGGSRLFRLFPPGVIGEDGVASELKYDARLVMGDFGDPGASRGRCGGRGASDEGASEDGF